MSSREQQKREARERRQAEEQAAATAAQRRRRLQLVGGAVAAAAVVVVVAVLVSSGGGGSKADKVKAGKPAPGATTVRDQYAGIPEKGLTLGRDSAPVTMIQYVDLKCPTCQAYELGAFPTILRDWVKTGKVRVETRLQHFVGNEGGDSTDAAKMALATAEQNRFYPFAALFYRNQGNEQDEYVTDSFLTSIGKGVDGLDVAKALKDRDQPSIKSQLDDFATAFDDNGFTGTPSFTMGTTGGTQKAFEPSNFGDPGAYTPALGALVGSGQ